MNSAERIRNRADIAGACGIIATFLHASDTAGIGLPSNLAHRG
jgi:hypothetical protein